MNLSFSYAQTNLKGTVLDASSQQPVPYATVYVSGTTNGTITDEDGKFVLKDIPYSSKLIISHASYNPKALNIVWGIPTELFILLQEKEIDLSEVKVESKSLRDKNLEIFKKWFLGSDHWGNNVVLHNDSTLIFYNEYDDKRIMMNNSVRNEIESGRIKDIYEWGADSSYIVVRTLSSFKAKAKSPLIIDMPLLGYKLQVDLVDFSLDYIASGQRCNFLGYYYFQPYETNRKSKVKKYERNRQSVYYNSSLHFLRSLYEKKLGENGYEIVEKVINAETNKGEYKNVNIDSSPHYINGNRMQITGLKDKKLTIFYYSKGNGSPVDLTSRKKTSVYNRSELYFLSDTCIINREGTIPNNDIMFGGEIGVKKVGSCLPENYYLEDQTDSPEPVSRKLAEYITTTHPEKLFVATDRDIYLSEDTLWFSAWLLNSGNLSPEKFEKILYIDMVNPDGKTVLHYLFEIQNGRAIGQFVLREAFKTGIFKLRAYTNYIRNKGPEFIFEKSILIYSAYYDPNSNKEKESDLIKIAENPLSESGFLNEPLGVDQTDLDVQFLPEGGNWVENIPCRMAFIGTSPTGYPPEYTGIVYDQYDNYVTVFKPQHNGKGIFTICPDPNILYHAIIKDEDGNKTRFELPVAEQQGFTLSVKDDFSPNQLRITINSSENVQNYDLMYLVITQNYKVIQTIPIIPDRQTNTVILNKSLLASGIAVITLFNSENVPLCERLIFINNNDFLNFSVDSIEGEGDSVLYKITVNDKNSNSVNGSFAVSVTGNSLLDSEQTGSTSNMVNYLFLKSELPGIDDDCSYFYKTDPESKWITDLTMMTNGWRQFAWQEVLADSIRKPIFPLEQRFYISGEITRSGKNKPAKNIDVTMVGTGTDTIGGQTKTNKLGKFMFQVDYFTDTMNFFVRTKNQANVRWYYNISLTTNMGDARSNRIKFMHDQLSMQSTNEQIRTIPMNKRNLKFEKKPELNSLTNLSTNRTGTVDSIGKQVSSVMKKRKLPEAQLPLPDTTDVVLNEISVHAERILTPIEKMRKKYGIASRTMGAEQLHIVQESNLRGTGLWSYIFKLIPDYRYLRDVGRIYIFVDGKLHYFTHRPHIPECIPSRESSPWLEWYAEILSELDISEIKSVEVIENPKSSPIGLAMELDPGVECEEKGSPEYIISVQTISGKELRPNHYFIGIAETSMIGFTPTKKFYMPKYTDTPSSLNRFSTLYWSANRSPNNQGEIIIKLPKDIPVEDYVLQVNGLSDLSVPGYLNQKLKQGISAEPKELVKEQYLEETQNDNRFDAHYITQNETETDSIIRISISASNNRQLNVAEVSSAKGSFLDQPIFNGTVTLPKRNLVEGDTLLISVPGWGNLFVTPEELKRSNYKLIIPNQVFAADSVFYATEYMNSVFLKIPQNIKLTKYDVAGSFRQLMYKDNNLVRLTDFGFIHKFEGMDNVFRKFKQSVTEIHQFCVPEFEEKVPFKLKNDSFTIAPALNPNATYLSFMYSTRGYRWKYFGQQYFNHRLSTIIKFEAISRDPQIIHSGFMIIDDETKGIAHVQWHVAPDKAKMAVAGYYLAPEKNPGGFSLLMDQHYATFVLSGRDWKLKSASQYLQFSYNEDFYKVLNEMVITDLPKGRTKRFKATTLNKMTKETQTVKDVKYNPLEWRSEEVLLPDKTLQEQIKNLNELTVFSNKKDD